MLSERPRAQIYTVNVGKVDQTRERSHLSGLTTYNFAETTVPTLLILRILSTSLRHRVLVVEKTFRSSRTDKLQPSQDDRSRATEQARRTVLFVHYRLPSEGGL